MRMLPDDFDPTADAAGYDNIVWAGSPTEDHRDYFLEWQHGLVWIQFGDTGEGDPHIKVQCLSGRNLLPMGVVGLDDERGLRFELGAKAGGITTNLVVHDQPAVDAVVLVLAGEAEGVSDGDDGDDSEL